MTLPNASFWKNHKRRFGSTTRYKIWEKFDRLFEENYDGGLGVVGIEKTLAALSNGQVQEIYLSADFGIIKYNKNKVEQFLGNYAPGEGTEPPNVRKAGMIVDE